MKTLFLTVFMTFSAMAADYNCRVDMVKLELKTNGDLTELIVKDAQTGEFYYNGIVTNIMEGNNRTDLMFETRSHTYLQLQFKTSALEKEEETLFGFARGWTGGGFVDSSLRCSKKTL